MCCTLFSVCLLQFSLGARCAHILYIIYIYLYISDSFLYKLMCKQVSPFVFAWFLLLFWLLLWVSLHKTGFYSCFWQKVSFSVFFKITYIQAKAGCFGAPICWCVFLCGWMCVRQWMCVCRDGNLLWRRLLHFLVLIYNVKFLTKLAY